MAERLGTSAPHSTCLRETGLSSNNGREGWTTMLVQDVMTREPTTVTPETSIKRAAEILVERQISSLPVLDERGRVCGVLSEADLIRDAFVPDARGHMLPARYGEHGEHPTQTSVEDEMTPHAITAHATGDIAAVAGLVQSAGVKSIPVIDDDRHRVGVVSRSDLVRVRARADELIAREVDARLVSMGLADWRVSVTGGNVELDGPAGAIDRSM